MGNAIGQKGYNIIVKYDSKYLTYIVRNVRNETTFRTRAERGTVKNMCKLK